MMLSLGHEGSESSEDHIDCMAQPNCLMCGSGGTALYETLGDRLFGAPGLWTLKKCANLACGLLWLDPMPTADEVWKAYRNYYTHADYPRSQLKQDLARRIFRRSIATLKASYLRFKYGYSSNEQHFLHSLLGPLAYVMPWRRSEWDMSVMFLPSVPGGRLLEVGCGAGRLLLGLRHLGWDTLGVDVDRVALESARMQGLEVNLGALEALCYPDNHFDAVILSHVIEHVHDPVGLIRECHRVLKPDGRLSLVTPNAQSFFHQLFGRSWLALDPPRHLHIFDIATLKSILCQSGFQRGRVFTTIREGDAQFVASRSIRRTGHFKMLSPQPRWEKIAGRIAQIVECAMIKMRPSAGEELSAVMQK